MILNSPISTKTEDLFHLHPVAKRMANILGHLKNNEASVISIEGPWGNGKTSFINLILEELPPANNLIVKVNPWNFSNPNELIKDFFNSIMNALIKDNKKHAAIVEKISKYVYKLLKLGEIKVAPEINILGMLNIKLGEFKALENTLTQQTDEINNLFIDFGKKIIIVIDNIDRLDVEETNLVFKLVKITSDFSNIRFLLAYDKKVVCERLFLESGKGEEYLKKIVHLSFPLPHQNREHLFSILCNYLQNMININIKHWDETRWEKLSEANFNMLFENIRDVKHYINSFLFDLEIMDDIERNGIDFIAIEAIRVFAPSVYVGIGSEHKLFTQSVDADNNETLMNKRERCEAIFRKAPESLIDPVREIILFLFPQIKAIYLNEIPPEEIPKVWKKDLRICAEEHFDRYFNSFTSDVFDISRIKLMGKIDEAERIEP